MNGPREHFHSMTDAQLAEWHRQTMQLDKLMAERDALTVQLYEERQQLAACRGARTADELDHRAECVRLTASLESAESVAHRSRKLLCEAAAVAVPALRFWLAVHVALGVVGMTAEEVMLEKNVREMLTRFEQLAG